MFMFLKELYYDNGNATILLELENYKEDGIIKNIPYSLKLNNKYIINLEHHCFENEYLNNLISEIMKKYNLNYIDKELWKQYLDDIEEEKRNNLLPYNVIEKPAYDIYGEFKKLNVSAYNFNFDNDYEKLYYESESGNNCIKIISFKDRIFTEEDYAITLLNFIFNSNFNLKIGLCKNCNKPFLTNTLNLLNCKRIYKNNITCNQYAIKIRKQHQYEEPIKHLVKNVRDKLKSNEDKLEEFNKFLPKKKEEYFNDNKQFILWLLDTYYTKEGKEKAIIRLGLTKYF